MYVYIFTKVNYEIVRFFHFFIKSIFTSHRYVKIFQLKNKKTNNFIIYLSKNINITNEKGKSLSNIIITLVFPTRQGFIKVIYALHILS